MNCREFATLVPILAGPQAAGGDVEHVATGTGLQHAERCARCAARLAEERNLSTQLDQLARSTASVAAPPRLESALRAAFRQHWQSSGSRMRSCVSYSSQPRRRGWTAAMAAAVLAAVAASLMWRMPRPVPPAAGPPTPVATAVAPQPAAESRPVQSDAHAFVPETFGEQEEGSALETPVYPRMAVSAQEPRTQDSVGSPYHAPSDFVPLLYGGDPMLTQTAVVRVELSGAMLQSLGFPVLGEPSERRVQADLMLGADGVARAIRLVPASASGFAGESF